MNTAMNNPLNMIAVIACAAAATSLLVSHGADQDEAVDFTTNLFRTSAENDNLIIAHNAFIAFSDMVEAVPAPEGNIIDFAATFVAGFAAGVSFGQDPSTGHDPLQHLIDAMGEDDVEECEACKAY